MRLNTRGLSMTGIAQELDNRNMTFAELYAMPELDKWIYSDGPSYTCGCFVAGLLKAGGLMGSLEIQATEFTPRDVYSLSFYDKNPVLPKECS